MKKSVLITGGAGYIGSHTVVLLHQFGYTPIIIDNLCNSSLRNINGINKILNKKIKWYNIDCTNYEKMKEIFINEKYVSGCIHFAAYKSVEESIRMPEKYYQNNIKSLEVVLQCMNEFGLDNIIFSSSCTVYGKPNILPVKEDADFKSPESVYSETKQICEEIINKSKCSSISLRYFNPIGTHSSILIGDCSADKPSNLVPVIAEKSLGIRQNLIVNGNDYLTHDGTCIRDYIHVMDLADAHIKAFDFLMHNKFKKFAFNVGTGKGMSVLDIIKLFEKVNNIKIDYSIGPRRKGDVEIIYADNKKITKLLNWEPTRSLNDALISEYKWKKLQIC